MKENIKRILGRLRGIMARSVVTGMDLSLKNPKMTVADKVSEERDVELFQPFGLAAFPKTEAGPEVLTFSLTGAGDTLIGLGVTGGTERPRDGQAGEAIIYHYDDKNTPQRIHLKDGGDIEAKSDAAIAVLGRDRFEITLGDNSLILNADGLTVTIGGNEFKITADETVTTEDLKAKGISVEKHIHTGVLAGGAVSGPPQK